MTSKLKTEWGEEGHGEELGSDRKAIVTQRDSASVHFLGASEITSLPLRPNGWRDIAGNKKGHLTLRK